MRRTGVWVVAAVVSLAACELPHPDPGEPDAFIDGPPQCHDDRPGCTEEDCGLTCDGDELYSCSDGHWVATGYCEWCVLGGLEMTRWTWTQTFDLTTCPSVIEPRGSVVADMMPSSEPPAYESATADDPALALTVILHDGGGLDQGVCSYGWTLDFNDVWIVDGVATPVTGEYQATGSVGARIFAEPAIAGSITVHVGSCEVTGTMTGTWEYTTL